MTLNGIKWQCIILSKCVVSQSDYFMKGIYQTKAVLLMDYNSFNFPLFLKCDISLSGSFTIKSSGKFIESRRASA